MKAWKNGIAAAAIMVGALLAGTCVASPHADFVVTSEPVGPPLVGFGACMNPYLYAHPNWPAEVNEGNVGKLEAEAKALHPQFVRIFFLSSWWEGDTDPVIAKGKPGMKESLIRTIRLAQESGAAVLLQYWYDPKRYADTEDVAKRFARTVAEMRNGLGLKAVRYVTMQNEPNDNGKDITREQYVRLYQDLDKAMRDAGIRKDVQIIGGDLVSVNQADWFTMLGRELSPVLDGYSIHAYWGYWDTAKLVRRIRETRQQVDALPAEQRRPLYVTEFGVQGKRPKPNVEPGFYDDGRVVTEVPAACAQVAWFMMEALNNGFSGTSQWDMYEVWYDRKMGYGVIGSAEKGWPERPGYGLLEMFTHAVRPGWRTVKVDGNIPDVLVTAVGGADGRAVFILNRGESREFVVGGMEAGRPIAVRIWNQDERGKLTDSREVRADEEGRATVRVVRGSIIMLRS